MNEKQLEKVWKKYLVKKDEANKKKLVEHYYIFLVKKIAKGMIKRFNGRLTADELASYGIDGLYKAIKAYDPSRKTKFDTYAYPRIWGSIIDGIRHEDWVPRSVRQRQTKIEKAKQDLEYKNGHKADELEAIQEAGYDVLDFQKRCHKFYAASCSSIETSVNYDDNNNGFDTCKKDFNKYLVAKNDYAPESQIENKEFFSKIVGKNFTPLERKIVYYYYYNGFSMTEISKKIDISESKICQMHKNIIKKIKKKTKNNPKYFETEEKYLSELSI